ncbi:MULTISPECIES: acetolactate synthase catalytic subunit [Brucella]|uniref:Acetolactate synthase catalytic subunit n=1 Tax=Ochrobactrum soli TaxID=2448455 RepID=A0A849KQI6_9HYPH|nr:MULTISPECIES: acetolactate synthase catalytic subunit [Brucella]MCI1002333.1 acetolactate synthase catalytic subunit [Ochrobactrum sp. C6C9]MDX4072186.1 acetolactate synthase catalytic subunit [Brucella sp. NBRC 113783]NNU60098.1 acetolactate synthase catalytic subunit [[Ochrobactrum] soli]RRD26252.1 acetolactate synthase catalytic subunit [Brucellaceae bacterium VT-16-1752]
MLDVQRRSNRTGAHILAGALQRHGVTRVFGQSIPSAFFLAAPDFGITQVGYRTENAGAAMADAYARVSGQVAVVTAQNGPAATLLVPGLAEALKASIPVVAIVQDVHRQFTDKNAFQELDHLALFDGAAKWVRRVSEISRIEDYVDMAFTAATTGRAGPAVLLVPLDVLDELDDGALKTARQASLGHYPLDPVAPDPARVSEAAALLASARHPLVIAGGGVHSARGYEALSALQALGFPVATTVMGKGAIDETNPLSLGVVGYFMGPGARAGQLAPMVQDADVILLVGNRTNQNGTDSWQLYPKDARYIQIDIDGTEVGRNYEALRLVGDARLGLEALVAALKLQDLSVREAQRSATETRIRDGLKDGAKLRETKAGSDATPLRPERIVAEIDRLFTPDSIVVADASYSSIWVADGVTIRSGGQRVITPRGLAGLGWGLPFALGAKAARPQSPVICLTGDGGFAHVWAEIETSKRMNLPVVVVVLNNQILGYQKHAELSLFGAYTDVVHFQPVDHAAIAQACGVNGIRVERADQLAAALETALRSNVLTVIDVVTDERAYPPVTSFTGKQALDY